MDVHFTPEQEAQIAQAARSAGTDAQRLVHDAALQFVDDANFRAAVLDAKEYADHGEFIEEDEMTFALKKCSVPKCASGGRRPQLPTCRASANPLYR